MLDLIHARLIEEYDRAHADTVRAVFDADQAVNMLVMVSRLRQHLDGNLNYGPDEYARRLDVWLYELDAAAAHLAVDIGAAPVWLSMAKDEEEDKLDGFAFHGLANVDPIYQGFTVPYPGWWS